MVLLTPENACQYFQFAPVAERRDLPGLRVLTFVPDRGLGGRATGSFIIPNAGLLAS